MNFWMLRNAFIIKIKRNKNFVNSVIDCAPCCLLSAEIWASRRFCRCAGSSCLQDDFRSSWHVWHFVSTFNVRYLDLDLNCTFGFLSFCVCSSHIDRPICLLPPQGVQRGFIGWMPVIDLDRTMTTILYLISQTDWCWLIIRKSFRHSLINH